MNTIHQSPHQRLTFDVVRQQARGYWRHVLLAVGVPEQCLSKRHGPCPACGGKDRFRFDDKNESGSFFCNNCGAGDGFKLVQLVRRCSPADALHLVADYFNSGTVLTSIPPVAASAATGGNEAQAQERKQRNLERVWNEGLPLQPGDPAWSYIVETRRRKLPEPCNALRFHPSIWFDGAYVPALVAAVRNLHGQLVSVHRTFLIRDHGDNWQKLERRFMPSPNGALRGAAIQLVSLDGDTLCVGEGIETSMACWEETGLPVWSVLSAGGMRSFEIPCDVKHLVIFADNDAHGVGQEAAMALRRRALATGVGVRLLVPLVGGTDFDDFVNGGDQ